jgi:hypothetical protein
MRPLTIFVGAVLAVLLAGCGRSDPKTLRIANASPGALALWRATIQPSLNSAQWRELEAAVQEVRWSVTARGSAANDPATVEALGERLQGRTLDEVLRLGWETKLRRLEGIRAELKEAVNANALIASADAGSDAYLTRYRREQRERLAALDEELAAALRRFAELGGKRPPPEAHDPPRVTPGDNAPAVLSRAEALREIQQMAVRRREAALFAYGSWSVKLDEDGTQLSPAEAADFAARRQAAEKNGHTVVALRVNGVDPKWRIFDDKIEVPGLSPSVTGHLTAADLRDFAANWRLLQAEVWARRVNFEEPGSGSRGSPLRLPATAFDKLKP